MKKSISARNAQIVCNIETIPWPHVSDPGSLILDSRS